MIVGKEYQHIISRIFGGDVKNYLESTQIQVNCPRCQDRDNLSTPDGKYNLEINTAKEVFRCWKCDSPKFSGSLNRLIKLYGTYSDHELYRSYGGGLIDIFNVNVDEEDEFEKPIKLPDEFIKFSNMDYDNPEHQNAYMYMVTERKINRDLLIKYNIGFCCSGFYSDRIIIPSYNNEGEVNYFISRSYLKNTKQPYNNPKIDKDVIIFNEGYINWDSQVFIVEGAFEMFSVVNGIPQLGKTISKALFLKLKEKKPQIVIVLDPDAYKDGIRMFQLLSVIYGDENYKVKIVKLRGKDDLDEIRKNYGDEGVLKVLRTATELSTDDYINMRLYSNNEYDKYRKRNN